jgi:hypothetical protein
MGEHANLKPRTAALKLTNEQSGIGVSLLAVDVMWT